MNSVGYLHQWLLGLLVVIVAVLGAGTCWRWLTKWTTRARNRAKETE